MPLEAATFISGLNASNPVGVSDPKSQGDDHLRLIKSTLLNTFPNITGAVNATQAELNRLVGVTGVTGAGALVLGTGPTIANPTISGVMAGNFGVDSILTLRSVNQGQVIFAPQGNVQAGANWLEQAADGGTIRWALGQDASSNGYSFFLNRYDATGAFVARPFHIDSVTGAVVTTGDWSFVGTHSINGSGAALCTIGNAVSTTQALQVNGGQGGAGVVYINALAGQYQLGFMSATVTRGFIGCSANDMIFMNGGTSTLFTVALATGAASFVNNIQWGGGAGVLTFAGSDSYWDGAADIILRSAAVEKARITSTGLVAAIAVSTETTGALTSASRNRQVHCTGNITLPSAGMTDGDVIPIDPRGTARTISRPGGHTMYVNDVDVASATTSAHNICAAKYHGGSKWTLQGAVL